MLYSCLNGFRKLQCNNIFKSPSTLTEWQPSRQYFINRKAQNSHSASARQGVDGEVTQYMLVELLHKPWPVRSGSVMQKHPFFCWPYSGCFRWTAYCRWVSTSLSPHPPECGTIRNKHVVQNTIPVLKETSITLPFRWTSGASWFSMLMETSTHIIGLLFTFQIT
jgi:hypothetical protein